MHPIFESNILLFPLYNSDYYDITNPDFFTSPYFAKIIFFELIITFIFTLIFLIVKYDEALSKTSFIVRGFGMLWTMTICLMLCYFSSGIHGGCLNPALGFTMSVFQVGLVNDKKLLLDYPHSITYPSGGYFARCIWIYMIVPFIGAILAAIVFKYHKNLSKIEVKD